MAGSRLVSLATAVPAYRIDQAQAAGAARRLFGSRSAWFDRLMPAFDNAGIASRGSCVPVDWYQADHDWPERNRIYVDSALSLLEQAARACLADADVAPEAVDAIVTVSTTGIATPSLDARLMERLAFPATAQRLPVFGLGCAGGVLGLARSAALARAMPGARVLLLVVELCGLTFRRADTSKSNVIATALFGDGAAAALIESGGPAGAAPGTILAWGEHRWPDSLGIMGWSVESDGLGVIFSRDIPALVRRDLRPAAEAFLQRHGVRFADLDGVICHPGGAKVIDALRHAFELGPDGLSAEAATLRDHGNMSAATILFVLERRRREGLKGLYLLSALGPGFTVGFVLMAL
ncbi:MAG: type III polyketide synthase [Rhodospirillaceae bacterium]|nr:type III polyketide synthase [Rhodospirillaceae bacterium]